ncbi:MAG: CGGC domain-containing protein [Deltaproteobacteria bacterium]|nr:CGGC domain-containing protein [Deltaproteobacteria bacterium]
MTKNESIKIGIIICNRYHCCAGGKCFRALREREGAFSLYCDRDAALVGYTTCDGCPGGNIEYAPGEMIRNGANVIHLATGLIVGYPPCPRIGFFRDFIQSQFGIDVVFGTHPIPQKYYLMHQDFHTWDAPFWQEVIRPVLTDEKIRLAYD